MKTKMILTFSIGFTTFTVFLSSFFYHYTLLYGQFDAFYETQIKFSR